MGVGRGPLPVPGTGENWSVQWFLPSRTLGLHRPPSTVPTCSFRGIHHLILPGPFTDPPDSSLSSASKFISLHPLPSPTPLSSPTRREPGMNWVWTVGGGC